MYYELYKIYKAMNHKTTKRNTDHIYKKHFFDKKMIEYVKESINKSIKNIELTESKKINNNNKKIKLNKVIINANTRHENEKRAKAVILGLSAISFSAYLVYYFTKR
jgi:hypothetical protein